MKRKLSAVLPPDAFKDKVVVPFSKAHFEQTAGEGPPGPMFKFRLRNGFVGQVSVSEKEADRLWSGVQAPDDFHHVIVFDSAKQRIALNLEHVVASQFDYFGESGLLGTWIDEGENVSIYFADSATPLELDIEPDEMTPAEFDKARIDDNDLCQLGNLFFYFDTAHEGSEDVERLRDAEGSIVWLRINEISLATVPLALMPVEREKSRKKGTRSKKKSLGDMKSPVVAARHPNDPAIKGRQMGNKARARDARRSE
jgi:hypothetical protein